MDDEVRRLERCAARDPSLRPALDRARRRAGVPGYDLASVVEEARRLARELEQARDAYALELARCWGPFSCGLFADEPGLDVLVVDVLVEPRPDRQHGALVHAAVHPDAVQAALGTARNARLSLEAARRIAGEVLEFAPLLAAPEQGDEPRLLLSRAGASDLRAERADPDAYPDVIPRAVRAVQQEGPAHPAARRAALAEVGARELTLRERLSGPTGLRTPVTGSRAALLAAVREVGAWFTVQEETLLEALDDAWRRLLPALHEARPDLGVVAVHGWVPDDHQVHTQRALACERPLRELAQALQEDGLDDLGLERLAERAPWDPVLNPAPRELEPFGALFEARHGTSWVLVLERGEHGLEGRVGPAPDGRARWGRRRPWTTR